MIDQILTSYAKANYDFRDIGHPRDPLKHLWQDWLPYYRMKVAIAEVIQPSSIFEFGVRFGYSAATFLHGAPGARYTGIDLDGAAFGGVEGGLSYAKSHLPPTATLIKGNSQELKELPDGPYDLVHVDGQQDEAGFYRDLELALQNGKFVLCDGYFWTRDNFLAASEFLLRHRDLLDYSIAIPGYAGELLLKVKTSRPNRPPLGETHHEAIVKSSTIRGLYTRDYYERDCGGWEFQQGLSRRLLQDARLRAVYNLAMSHSPRRLLDIGCGRGELCRQAAQSGIDCVGIDYSSDAIEIAREAVAATPEIAARIVWRCEDASCLPENEPFDVIILSDVVEHLAFEEVDILLQKAARLLSPSGRLIVHTFPNRWFYDYDYVRRRRAARSLGAYLPAEPRSRREREMHINEWNPRTLRRLLRKRFPHALLWFGTPEAPVASLAARHSPWQLAAQRDLFAAASSQPISDYELRSLYLTEPLRKEDVAAISISANSAEMKCRASEPLVLTVNVQNGQHCVLSSEGEWPTYLCYHLVTDQGTMLVFEGHRNRLSCSQPAGTLRTHTMLVPAPSVPGEYRLQLTLVQERVAWLADWSPTCLSEVRLIVS